MNFDNIFGEINKENLISKAGAIKDQTKLIPTAKDIPLKQTINGLGAAKLPNGSPLKQTVEGIGAGKLPDGTSLKQTVEGVGSGKLPNVASLKQTVEGVGAGKLPDGTSLKQTVEGVGSGKLPNVASLKQTVEGMGAGKLPDGSSLKQSVEGVGAGKLPDGTSLKQKVEGLGPEKLPNVASLKQTVEGVGAGKLPDGSSLKHSVEGVGAGKLPDGSSLKQTVEGVGPEKLPNAASLKQNIEGLGAGKIPNSASLNGAVDKFGAENLTNISPLNESVDGLANGKLLDRQNIKFKQTVENLGVDKTGVPLKQNIDEFAAGKLDVAKNGVLGKIPGNVSSDTLMSNTKMNGVLPFGKSSSKTKAPDETVNEPNTTKLPEKPALPENEGDLKKLLGKFSENTSMPGVGQVNMTKSSKAKLLWPILILCGAGLMAGHLYLLVSDFEDVAPTLVESNEFKSLPLPAVTICNANPIMNSQLHQLDVQLQSLLGNNVFATDENNTRTFANVTLSPNMTANLNVTWTQNVTMSPTTTEYFNVTESSQDFGSNIDELTWLKNTISDLYMKENRTKRIQVGHSIENMLLRCTFGETKCSASNFNLRTSPTNGNCFTIHSNNFIVNKAGPAGGLSLMLFLDTNEYVSGVSESHGVNVQVHSPSEHPDPYNRGFFVDSGSGMDVAMTKMTHLHTEDCITPLTEDANVRYFYRQTCQDLCRAKHVVEQCTCYDRRDEDVILFTKTDVDVSHCDDEQEKECISNATLDFINKELTCPCPVLCIVQKYEKIIVSRSWPLETYGVLLRETMCRQKDKNQYICHRIKGMSGEELQKNLVKVNIYFGDLNQININEKLQYKAGEFSADLGGAISLWIGLSLLSLLEVCNLGLQVCRMKCKCKRPPKREKKPKQVKPKPVPFIREAPERKSYLGPF